MIASGVAVAGYAAQGNYKAAAAASVGFIPGGKLVGAAASKFSFTSKVLTKTMNVQAKARVIGANSKAFGYAAHGTKSFGNKTLPKATHGWLRAGWAQGATQGSIAWRVGTRGNVKLLVAHTSLKLKRFR